MAPVTAQELQHTTYLCSVNVSQNHDHNFRDKDQEQDDDKLEGNIAKNEAQMRKELYSLDKTQPSGSR